LDLFKSSVVEGRAGMLENPVDNIDILDIIDTLDILDVPETKE
jgi:hypothetical protein